MLERCVNMTAGPQARRSTGFQPVLGDTGFQPVLPVPVLGDTGWKPMLPVMLHAFDPNADVEVRQRNLPHWRQPGATYFVTFRPRRLSAASEIGQPTGRPGAMAQESSAAAVRRSRPRVPSSVLRTGRAILGGRLWGCAGSGGRPSWTWWLAPWPTSPARATPWAITSSCPIMSTSSCDRWRPRPLRDLAFLEIVHG